METFVPSFDCFTIICLIIGGFIGAFVDASVGGGGLITTPTLLSLGLPVTYALGTNKLAGSMGTVMSFLSFWKAGKISKTAILLMPVSILASYIGAYVVYLLPEALLKNIIVVLLIAVAIYTYRRSDWGDNAQQEKLTKAGTIASVVLAAALGFYDGFFGPGTGSFLIFCFLLLGLDFVAAAGNAKALNLASGIGGLVSFAVSGTVVWIYGIIMGISMMLGAYFGAQTAIKKGAAYVRPLFLTVTTLLILKQVYSLFSN